MSKKSNDKKINSFLGNSNLVSIIILTHNQLNYTKACVDSILEKTKTPFEIIFIDNASTDGTPEYLKNLSKTHNQIQAIFNNDNLGFPAGVNQGILKSKGNYLLFLNNDIVVTNNWLENMIKAFDKDPQLGIAGPLTNSISGPQQIEQVNYDMQSLSGLEEFSVDLANSNAGGLGYFWRIVGFAMLVKREVINKIGGFDVRFGKGNFEDDDFSLRASIAGYRSGIVFDSFIHHFRSRSFATHSKDYFELLQNNWQVFKNKWGIDTHIKYGEPFDLDALLKVPFEKSKHYCEVTSTLLLNNKPAFKVSANPNNILVGSKLVKPKVSICIIAKNEQDFIKGCLDSVNGLADEIILVDTGSTDETIKIAESLGAKVFNYKWNDSFSDARNFAMDKANGEWILILDADEQLDKNAPPLILEAIDYPKAEAYEIAIVNYLSAGNPPDVEISRTCRLVRNRKAYRFIGSIHEQISPSVQKYKGNIGLLDCVIHHHGYRPEIMKARNKNQRNLALLEKELMDNPKDLYYLFHLSNEYYSTANYEKVIEVLEKAAGVVPKNHAFGPQIFSHLADSYMTLGYNSKALEAVERGEKTQIPHPQLLHSKGNIMRLSQKYEEAIDAYQAAITLGQDGLWVGDSATYGYKAYYGAAASLLCIEAYDEAVKMAEIAVKCKPDNKECLKMLKQTKELAAKQTKKDKQSSLSKRSARLLYSKPKLSLCMIVKNEERFLKSCLESVKDIVDEMIVVDTGSNDSTVEIAEKMGAVVKFFEWNNSFSDARNESLKYATGDWVLVLDADEELLPESKDAILRAISNPVADAYELFFKNAVTMDDTTDYTEHKVCRLFKNRPEYRYESRIHENIESQVLVNGGTYTHIEATIMHYGYADTIVLERNKSERYIKMLEEELAAHPGSVFYMYHISAGHCSYGNFKEALPYLEEGLKIAPLNSTFLSLMIGNLVNCYCEVGEPEKALKTALDAEDKQIHHPQIYFCKGKAYTILNREEEAIECYKKAMELSKGVTWNGDTTIAQYKAALAIATHYKRMENFKSAIEYAEIAKKGKLNYWHIHELLAQCYAADGQLDKFEESLTELQALIKDDAGPTIRIAELHEKLGKKEEAIKQYENALKYAHPTPILLCKIADMQMELGMHAKAEANYKHCISLDAKCVQAMDKLGCLYSDIKNFKDALNWFANAIETDPNYSNSYFNAADMLYEAGNFEMASDLLQQGLSKNPEHAPGFVMLGNCCFKMGAYQAAVVSYRQALTINPGNTEAKNNLDFALELLQPIAKAA